ncbi:P27 family phage terminase small subunit [Aquamicrobium lusatiense]|uniref:P27 family phage terminase small subunit n=1 Tax=Aquamicrobium lusatiense TaxID=89772 RepID=UPI0024545B36|nr:P27 family phage terminase small subunit [Aquamicrobium lusatiense]MDH4993303.1 P27 family phage terminase small subunit [Aquamicrobium lusatiense]
MASGRKAGIIPAVGGVDEIPPPPATLDKFAKKVWREVIPDLVERRVLTVADLPGLRSFCIAVGKIEKLEKAIQKLGDDVDPVLYRLQDKAMATARQIGDHYGLSPTSRSRPSIRDGEDDDDDFPLVGPRRQPD